MRTSRVGCLDVPVIGLGCNNFGRGLDQEGATAVVHAALDAGITFFDTADSYGQSRSEEYLAAALGPRRQEVMIATKFGRPVADEPGSGGASPGYVVQAVERSLRHLGRDWIDLYQLHRPDPSVPIAETLGALAELVDSGKVRAIGCSNLGADELAEAHHVARANDLPAFVSHQVEYSAANRAAEHDGVIARCEETGVAVLPYRPLAKGLLTGRMRPGEQPVRQLAQDRYQRFLTDANFATIDRLRSFALAHGRSVAEAALIWLLQRPAVAAVFPGATKPEQVGVNAAAGNWELTADVAAELEAAASQR